MRKIVALGVAVLFLPSWLSAEAGRVGALTLLRGAAARPSALGEAFTAVPNQLDAMSINPASLAGLGSPTLSSTYFHGFAQDNFGSIHYAQPLPFGSVFVGGNYYSAGTVDLNQSDGTQRSVEAQQDSVGMVGIALGRKDPLSLGVTGKFFRSELAETVSASVAAADVGIQLKTPVLGLSFGAAVQNLGPELKFEEQGDPLPRTARAGVAYMFDRQLIDHRSAFPYKFLFLIDGVKMRDDVAGVRAGFEVARSLSFFDTSGSAALRLGYRSDAKVVDFGAGFGWGNFSLDYSLRLISDLDPSHRFTLAYRFAKNELKPMPRR